MVQYAVPHKLFDALIKDGRLIKAKKGQVVVGHDDSARDVYVVEEGIAQVSLYSDDGKETIFREIGPREMFGELAALDGAPRSASVTATSDMRLHKITAAQFEHWLTANSEAGLWFARFLIARIREMTERSFELATMTVVQRIHLEILRLAEHGAVEGQRVTIDHFPTQSEFAARIGTHREAISRELSWLRSEGLIESKSRTLVVLDIDRMRQLTGQS